ncbi:MAG: hypothetical protein ACRDNJ_00800 [Solirubrobacteraceae bacterium]
MNGHETDRETPALMRGPVAAEIATELPGLRLVHATAPGRARRTPPELVRRLRSLSDRWRGAGVVALRTQPVARAYRTFFRHVGLDPDVRRVPSEEAMVARLLHGAFLPTELIRDACLLALVETGVPVWALDGAVVDQTGLGIRSGPGPSASLVVADGRSVHAELFGEPLAGHGVGSRTELVTLFAVGVDGVPEIHIEEALWCVLELL